MKKVLRIAQNTFREAVRDKILYVIAFFAVLMILAGQGLGWVSVGEEAQIVQDFSLMVLSVFGALIAVFVGTQLIVKELEKRTIYTVLSKPVERWHFILGKYLGLLAVLACILLGMSLIACFFVYAAGGQITSLYVWALVLTLGELMIVTALAVFFSTLVSPILAAIFTFSAFLIGQVTDDLLRLATLELPDESVAARTGEHLTDLVSQTHAFWKPFGQALYHILPNFKYFHLRNQVTHGPAIDHGAYFLDGQAGAALLYALCYTAAILAIAMICFRRKKI